MTATVYSIFGSNGRTMTPITTDELPIGSYVNQNHRCDCGVVCEKQPYGYTVIYEDGSESTGQQIGALSPFTRIERTILTPASPDEVNRLIQLRDAKRMTDRWKQEQAAAKKAADIVKLVAELRIKYPWAVTNDASKNAKIELRRTFPGVKFSVRADHNSCRINWTDGPSSKQVDEVVGKYENGSFNGMEDIHEYDHSAYGEAIDKVLGRFKYVFPNRHYSDVLVQKGIDRVAEKFAGNIKRDGLTVELTPANYHGGKLWNSSPYTNNSNDRDSFQSLISQECERIGMMPKQG